MRTALTLRRLAAPIAVCLLITGCGGRGEDDSASAGITDTEITLGSSAPYSGPASAYGVIVDGIKACFEMVNDKGGVKMGDGKTRTIDLIVYDDAYDPARTQDNVRTLVEKDKVFALIGIIGTTPNAAIMDYVNQRDVPQLFNATGSSQWGTDVEKWPWTIGWQGTYANEAGTFATYLEQTMPEAKVAVLYQADDVGDEYLAGFKEAIKDTQITIVAEESYQIADPSVDSQVVNLSRSKADVFFNISTPKFAAQAIKKKAELGWSAQQFLISPSTSVEATLQPAGLELSKGIISSTYFKDPSDPAWADDPAVLDYVDAAKQFGDFNPIDVLPAGGWAVCETMVEVLEDTPEPTREALMDAVRHMDYELPLLMPGIDIKTDDGDGFPMEARQLTEFDGERWLPIGDVIDYRQ